MRKPTIAELREYAAKIEYRSFDAQAFLDHYESNGWYVGRTLMKDWQAAVRTWKRNDAKFRPQQQQPRLPYNVRQNRINALNRRKAALMRMKQTPAVLRELESIRIQLHKL